MSKKEIRFIDSQYRNLFYLPDGGSIQIHYPEETVIKSCKYIDEYHTQIGYNIFHICQFAELMEQNGASYMAEPEILGDEAAWKVGKDIILALQLCDDGYDYTLCDINYVEIDGGKWETSQLSMIEVRTEILKAFDLDCREVRVIPFEDVMEKVFEVGRNAVVVDDPIAELAYRIDHFAKDFDPYEYKDHVIDQKLHITQIQDDLRNGKTLPYRNFLESAISEALEKVDVLRAETLLKILDKLQVERDEKRISLEKRLAELQKQILATKHSYGNKEAER